MLSIEALNKIYEMGTTFEQYTGYKLDKKHLAGFAKEMHAVIECVGSLDEKQFKSLLQSCYKNMYKTLLENTLKDSLTTEDDKSEYMSEDFEKLMQDTFDLVTESITLPVDSIDAPSKTNNEISELGSKLLDQGLTKDLKDTLSSLNNKDLQKLCYKHESIITQILEARENGLVGPSWGEEKLNMYEATLDEMMSMLQERPSNEKTVKEFYNLTAPLYGGLLPNEINNIKNRVTDYAEELTATKLNKSVSELSTLASTEMDKNTRDNTYFKQLENVEKVGVIYNELNNRFSNRNIFSKLFHLDEYFAKNSILKNMMDVCKLSKESVMHLFENSKDTTYTSKLDDPFTVIEAITNEVNDQYTELGAEGLDKLTSIESNDINPDFVLNTSNEINRESIL